MIIGVLAIVFNKAVVQEHEDFWLKYLGKRYSEGERARHRLVGVGVGIIFIWPG